MLCFHGSGVEEVHVSKNVEYIGKYAFRECESLKKVSFAEELQLKEIRDYAFYKTSLIEIRIPSSVQTIGEYTF